MADPIKADVAAAHPRLTGQKLPESPDRIMVYRLADGEAREVYPVDAREFVASGAWTLTAPAHPPKAKAAPTHVSLDTELRPSGRKGTV